MNRSVNFRGVLILALTVPALLVGVHFLHAFQMQRGASDLLEQADRAAAENRPDEERQLLHDYLGLMPDAAAVQARYGLSLKGVAQTRDDQRPVGPAQVVAGLGHSLERRAVTGLHGGVVGHQPEVVV